MRETSAASHVIVNGTVQGVGFRKKVIAAARERNLTGWVANRKKGAVQAHLEGDPADVAHVVARISSGEFGKITFVTTFSVETIGYRSFSSYKHQKAKQLLENDEFTKKITSALHLAQKSYAECAVALAQDAAQTSKTLTASTINNSNRIFQAIPPNHITRDFSRTHVRSQINTFSSSFAAEIWSHSQIRTIRRKKLGENTPEDTLNKKLNAARFVERIGYRVPVTLQSNVPMNEVIFKPRTVVKPVSSATSHGAFSIMSENEIHDLGRARVLSSFDATRAAMQEYLDDARFQKVDNDAWLVEELIDDGQGQRPNDIKMLTFYGKVGLIQEEMKMPTRYCYYNRAGARISTGRYEDKAFEGNGFSEADIEMAEQISLKIPAPFMRIDFLKSGDGAVFGEFTPRPGNWFEFDPPTDRWLGKCFVEARTALDHDIRSGKTFVEYNDFVAEIKQQQA